MLQAHVLPLATTLITRIIGIAILWLMIFSFTASAQLQQEPHPLDSFLGQVLDFREPTGIRGRIRFIDVAAQEIWLDWEQRSDDRPLFGTGWKLVPGEPTLAVHPSDPAQFEALQQFQRGTPLEMVIQLDEAGHRRILSYRDVSVPPKIPL